MFLIIFSKLLRSLTQKLHNLLQTALTVHLRFFRVGSWRASNARIEHSPVYRSHSLLTENHSWKRKFLGPGCTFLFVFYPHLRNHHKNKSSHLKRGFWPWSMKRIPFKRQALFAQQLCEKWMIDKLLLKHFSPSVGGDSEINIKQCVFLNPLDF